jgi:hypothetical protein
MQLRRTFALCIAFLLQGFNAGANVVINEIHYNPDVKTEPAEFVELHNNGTNSVNVGGWSLDSGLHYTIPAGTNMAPGSYLVIAANPAFVLTKYGAKAIGPFTGGLSKYSDKITLKDASSNVVNEVSYALGFPWPTVGDPPGYSIELINPNLDNSLAGSWRGNGPTPGARNSVYATNAPPQIRQVAHTPEQPNAGDDVTITAKMTDPDGVANVTLEYQLVNPGSYIELGDVAYATNWTAVPMLDNGSNGDAVAGDDVYTAVMPGALQIHRRLVRYRITVTDTGNRFLRVPYADDPQPNFAYFCYSGVPTYTGQVQPASTPALVVSSNEMNRLPVYHLIAKSNSVLTATGWNPGAPNNQYGGDDYLWHGALIYDSKVYDHIGFRMRGGVWRYSMGKNAWKLALNRGHDFQARDDYGQKYNAVWRRLSFRPDIQQGDFLHRGEQGMFESVGYKFFRLAGVTAPKTTHIQFRIIDDAQEAPANNQYGGDFYGLYLAVEEQDGRLLEDRGLPDGNIYDMEAGSGTLNHTGSLGPTNKSDLNYFLSTYNGTNPADSWWRTNLNLTSYYSYQSILQGIHQYDIADGKNYFYYRNPVNGLWEPWPWDLDLTWADNMYRAGSAGGDEPFKSRVLSNFSTPPSHPVFSLEFKNRLREVRDLLFNNDQGYKLIDEMSALIHGPATNSITDADRCQWDYNPIMFNSSIVNLSKAGNYHFYQWSYEPGTSNNFFGTAQLMKNYMNYRISTANLGIGNTGMDGLAADAQIPSRPVVTYTGPTGFPINRLTFQSSSYVGQYAFASMKWRVGEIMDSSSPLYKTGDPWIYEIVPVWESGSLVTFTPDITIPIDAMRSGHRYRVRAEVTDVTGRTSNWSLPVEFVSSDADNAGDLLSYLRITEVMYNPPAGGFEFIELHNISPSTTLDLRGVKFTAGIDFTFAAGTSLPPNGYLLLVNTADFTAFRMFYGLDGSVPLVGPFTASSLNNAGETVTLKTSAGGLDIVSFTYSDSRGWPITADGSGHSLVLQDSSVSTEGAGSAEYGANWRASAYLKGSPGQADTTPAPTVVLNEIAANTDGDGGLLSNDWIELYNASSGDVSIGPDWYLSDDGLNLKKWQVPQPTVIPAHGFLTFDEVTGFHNPTNIGFGLDKSGEQVFLSYLPGTIQDRVVDSVRFKAQEKNWSWGRYPDGGQFWAALAPQTRNATNAAPPLRVVVNEILYHPPNTFGTNDNSLDEFVEIYNPAASAVALYNTNGGWRLDGGVGFVFPTNQILNAGEYLVVVNFNPATNIAQLSAFKNLYGITNSGLTILGPYSGKLANSSDRVAIEKPQVSDNPLQPIAWVVVDEVLYADQTPWPCGSDGTGASLQRQNVLWHGSDAMIWSAAAPTAGRSNAVQIAGAPTIIIQPLGRVVPVGSQVAFNVAACGNSPFAYLWQFNGANLPGQTNATLVLTNLQIAQSGNYRVLVSNPYGSELSAIAPLVVQTVPGIVTQPVSQTVLLSNNVSFSVGASGSPPLFYQWRLNGIDLPAATNQTLTLTSVLASQAGDYSALVMNTAGTIVSSNATLTVLVPIQITNQPAPLTNIIAGGTLNLSVGVLGSGPLAYQWRFQEIPIAGATNAALILTNFQTPNAGPYRVTVSNTFSGDISGIANVAVLQPPGFTQQPASVTAPAGSSVTFTAAVTGSFPIGGRWTKSGVVLATFNGVTTNFLTFTLTNLKFGDNGLYRVVVTNAAMPAGTNSVQATLTVLAPPAFTSQPPGRTINVGASSTFTVLANGTPPLFYQWQMNGANIANATNSNYLLTNAQPSQEGLYSVTVTNNYGMTNSQPANLTVLFAPVLTNSVMLPNTGFKMFLLGNRNYNYILEKSTDFSNWTSWGSVIYSNGPMPLVDSNATNSTRSFYRARRNP